MKIIDKIISKQENLHESRQPVIAFLGDSVTQGCFELYVENGRVKPVTKSKSGYVEKVKEILGILYPTVPVNIVNAGISGDSAYGGACRLERDVLSYNPDLVVVCFALNDSGLEQDGLQRYTESLREIFDKINDFGAEIIFMTPNVKNDNVDVSMGEQIDKIAEEVAENERNGWLLKYLDEAKKICEEKNIPVCDCCKNWLKMREKKVNINNLLSNRINHPTEQLHFMFAYELIKVMFEN